MFVLGSVDFWRAWVFERRAFKVKFQLLLVPHEWLKTWIPFTTALDFVKCQGQGYSFMVDHLPSSV